MTSLVFILKKHRKLKGVSKLFVPFKGDLLAISTVCFAKVVTLFLMSETSGVHQENGDFPQVEPLRRPRLLEQAQFCCPPCRFCCCGQIHPGKTKAATFTHVHKVHKKSFKNCQKKCNYFSSLQAPKK